jgi:hypothetical protein
VDDQCKLLRSSCGEREVATGDTGIIREAGQFLLGGITYGGVGALLLLFALYGMALAIIGYIASPAVLSLEEMASGCRPDRRTPMRPRNATAPA